MSYHPTFLLDENVLTIYPACPLMKRWLTYKERQLVRVDRRRMETVETDVPLWWTAREISGQEAITTLQGLWQYLLKKCDKQGWHPTLIDERTPFPDFDWSKVHSLYPLQRTLLENGIKQHCSGIFSAPTRFGKCFGEDTPVLMWDGTVKMVQDIVDGDRVMGADSLPRTVTGTVRGQGALYRITPKNGGDPWVCNEDHILHIERTGESGRGGAGRKGRRENIPLKTYLGGTKWFRHVRKMRRANVEYPEAKLGLPPYIYGCWLGDGHAEGVVFTNAEPEVWEAIDRWALTQGLHVSDCHPAAGAAETRYYVTKQKTRGSSPWRQWFRKHPKQTGISRDFLIASRQQRLELLAGLIDTDGEVNGGKNYGVVTKYRQLALDVKTLCDSLGFPANVSPVTKQAQTGPPREYWRVLLRGAQMEIPVRVTRKKVTRRDRCDAHRFGFDVEPVGHGAYYGFELEGTDRLFLLKDGTVVHNTWVIANLIRGYPGLKTLVLVPGTDLGKQLYGDLSRLLDRDVQKLGLGSSRRYQGDDVTVCSMDSMHKCDFNDTRLIIPDEVHTLVTDNRLQNYHKFVKARKYGFGATAAGRYDNRDLLIEGAVGPILSEVTFKQAVDAGVIAPIRVFMLEVPYRVERVPRHDRNAVYDRVLWRNEYIGRLLHAICDRILPKGWQTLMFIEEEKSADFFQGQLPEASIAMAKKMTEKQREGLMNRMVRGEVRYCLASRIYSQGVTFPELRVVINLAGGGPNTYAVQKPGRVAMVMKGKRCGVLIDFLFSGQGDPKTRGKCWAPQRESLSRLRLYEEKGYDVTVVNDLAQFPSLFQEHCL